MNCGSFQNELFEYVEGSLSGDALATAEKHLAECDACRQAVEKEKRLVSALSGRFRQISQNLTLDAEIRRNILTECRKKGSVPTLTESVYGLWRHWVQMATIPVAVLLAVGVFRAGYFSMVKRHETNARRVAVIASPAQPSVSVQMSYCFPRRQFHQEENVVVDACVDETVVVNGAIPSGSLKNLPEKLEIKTPL